MKYEKWSLGYYLLKNYVRIANWLIHRNKIITGRENLPVDKPIVFAPNHQNALSDPMAVLLNTHYQPVWLARADIFKNKLVASILKFLKIMPVYRIRDGKENLSKNDETFNNSIKVLENNKQLGLFPEAAHTSKRQMIAHKKAVPRIVFQAEEKENWNLDIQIVPTGIYYSSYWKFNRDLIVNFGQPIAVKDFYEAYKENPSAATLQLRDKIYDAILPLVIQLPGKEHYNDFESIRNIYGNHFMQRQNIKKSTLNRFQSDQELATRLNRLTKQRPEDTKNLITMVRNYQTILSEAKVRSWLVEKPYHNTLKFFRNLALLIAGLPFFLYGFIFNAIPFLAIDVIVRKKVKDIAFWSSFALVLGILLFPVFYLIELALLWKLLPGFWLKLIFIISLPLLGKFAFIWYIFFRKTVGRFHLLIKKIFKRKEYYNLFKQKDLVFFKLDEMMPL
ncbi:MAG: hypothetical protein CSA36_06580 [Draconibacterium sp.]|nr:MAG: hypothetical protein CSA36_06580 [Draconibacterium sp.]